MKKILIGLVSLLCFIIGYIYGVNKSTLKVKNFNIVTDKNGLISINDNDYKVFELRPLRGTYEIISYDKSGQMMGNIYIPINRSVGDDATVAIRILDTNGRYEMHSIINADNFVGDKKNMIQWGGVLHSSTTSAKPILFAK